MFDNFFTQNQFPKFRIKQFNKHYYNEPRSSFDDFTTLSKDIREKLKSSFTFSSIKAVKTEQQGDNAQKVIFERNSDSKLFESVLIKMPDEHYTVCVSCMIGCPVGCTFCASGSMGFHGNLAATEIVDQVLYFHRALLSKNKRVTNVVYMGMGEPLLNIDEVLKSIQVLSDVDKIGIGQRRITISTVGIPTTLEALLSNPEFTGKIAISLHASNQTLREELIPIAGKLPLDDMMPLLDKFTRNTNRRVTYEYILIKNVNDTADNARELAELVQGKLAHINLIPYNPTETNDYLPTTRKQIDIFQQILEKRGITVTVRKSKGDEIQAACGQLVVKSFRSK